MSWAAKPPSENPQETMELSLEIIMAVDLSWSMDNERILKVKDVLRDFINQFYDENVHFGIVGFADYSEVLLKTTNRKKRVINIINNLKVGSLGNYTKGEPFTKSYNLSNPKKYNTRYLIILTDGVWHGDDANYIALSKKCINSGLNVIALGIGEADSAFLRKIAVSDDLAALTDLNNLSSTFSRIAKVISSNNGAGLRQ